MFDLKEYAADAESIIIAGHIRPDGDCVGACMAAYNYLKKIYSEKEIDVYLEVVPEKFRILQNAESIMSNEIKDGEYDLFIALDTSSIDRLGDAVKAFNKSKDTLVIDHHISNEGFCNTCVVDGGASSACEVLYETMHSDMIDYDIASALYIGIISDTAVFRYSSTSKRTMEIAGLLMETGIPFTEYIDKIFYERTYTQEQLLGRTLLGSMRLMDGICIVSTITERMMEFYGAKTEDIDGIIDQMRITEGVEVAILLHEIGKQEYKVSMRSNEYVDVNKVATYFGGGGHVKAAGCVMQGSSHDVFNNLTRHIEIQINERGNL